MIIKLACYFGKAKIIILMMMLILEAMHMHCYASQYTHQL